MEMMLGAVFLLYLATWYNGRATNLRLAQQWLFAHREYLEEQFALVGDRVGNEHTLLKRDGPADFLLYTSGRRNVQFAHWWIKLKSRNDVINYFVEELLAFFGAVQKPVDKVSVTLRLDGGTEKFVFAILDKSIVKETREQRYDLKSVTKISDASGLPSNLVVYSESQKLTDTILKSPIGQLLKKSKGLESLIISSLPTFAPQKFEGDKDLVATLTFSLKAEQDPLVELSCELPDMLQDLRFGVEIKNKLRKNREEIEKEYSKILAEERAEELARKKAEAKRAEEERIRKLPAAEQRKWEEKQNAKEMRKQQKKRTKRA
ncbi:uncharacterized protein BYT42DRAFT_279015 [Radiomyces spectabilis]|uniref:uncharacterized protein n=1 Tax=Radiomyces spectabilis TaxID=64574 RepID=UPI00221FCC76|nr:uncharacterized protein BYT42DRAFT_279015 [Radiomyces spectabilis]KAI8384913.1 hypothetical protein BYT42DRAFT_279015 [Radiomyces spectabilis]